MMHLSLLLPMFLTCMAISTPPEPSTSSIYAPFELKSVHLVFRHGESERATPDFYMKNPGTNRTDCRENPHVHLNLTIAGRMQSYQLGQFLRSYYGSILEKKYSYEEVYARTTYTERARDSLAFVMAGLYSPEEHQKWYPTVDGKPISIEAEGNTEDPLMWSIRCQTYLDERRRLERTKGYAMSIQKLVSSVAKSECKKKPKGRNLSDDERTDLYTKLWIAMSADVSLPDWSLDIFSNITDAKNLIRNATYLRYEKQNYNKRLIRLNGGMLLRKIIDDMKAVIEGKPMPKINLYAGHEFNVAALLYALGAWKEIVPTYLSFVAVEFWEKNSEYYVTVLYRDGRTGEYETRRINKCDKYDSCIFKDFEMLRGEYLPTGLDECYDTPDDVDDTDDDEESSIEVEGKTDNETEYHDYC